MYTVYTYKCMVLANPTTVLTPSSCTAHTPDVHALTLMLLGRLLIAQMSSRTHTCALFCYLQNISCGGDIFSPSQSISKFNS